MASVKCKMTKVGEQPSVVKECFGMQEAMNESGARSGVVPIILHNVNDKTTRMLVAVKSGKHKKRGLVMNFCPFCGERIYG